MSELDLSAFQDDLSPPWADTVDIFRMDRSEFAGAIDAYEQAAQVIITYLRKSRRVYAYRGEDFVVVFSGLIWEESEPAS